MSPFLHLYRTVLEALFPLSPAERELSTFLPEDALAKLPPAPAFTGLVVPLPTARALFAYKDERVSKLVWNIKYKRSAHAVKIGGYALWQRIRIINRSIYKERTTGATRDSQDTPSAPAGAAAGSPSPSLSPKRPSNLRVAPVVLIPMPITKKRRRERGYNQCELLIDEMERLKTANNSNPSANEAPSAARIFFEKDLLVRIHHANRQTLKNRADRIEGAKGIFAVNEEVAKRFKISDSGFENVILIVVDDVITTGSTMKAAMDALKSAGFGDVRGLALAH